LLSKFRVFWDVVSLEYTDVSEVRAASIVRAMMETVSTSETSVYSNETKMRYIPEDFNIILATVKT
jgi:deoxyinosine 3'endonuclease (endonuclease V)